MVAEADPLLAGLPLSAPVIDTAYDPAAAAADDVLSLHDALPISGLTLSADPPARFAVQPDGTVGARLKLDVPQAALSRLVTDTVRLAAPPALTDAWDGESVTVGAAGVHDAV